jgi:hypothetical protein
LAAPALAEAHREELRAASGVFCRIAAAQRNKKRDFFAKSDHVLIVTPRCAPGRRFL